jgi:predicted tellurium resistance membrane protein TerC
MIPYLNSEGLASFAALTFLEVVLGIDNIIFLAIAVEQLPPSQQRAGRRIGLALAMAPRIIMLVGVVWLAGLDVRLFRVLNHAFSVKDLVLIGGGLFLLAKGTQEVHDAVEAKDAAPATEPKGDRARGMVGVLVQICLINIVFSLDSVITAVGMTSELAIMIGAVLASTLIMVFAAEAVGQFIRRRPTTKMLALAFILLIGVALIADGLGFHIPRAYIYFAIAFSLFVEWLNTAAPRRRAERREARGAPPDAP